ncbi:Sporulation kinase E [compost metagenome]
MDKALLAKLFDPFFTTKEKGTGLGLSVSYRIIKNHRGNISVDSMKGSGTVFLITLPSV